MFLTLYVDDLLMLVANKRLLNPRKMQLMDRVEATDIGDVSRALGMNVVCDREKGTITITQTDSTEDVIERCGMMGCNLTYILGVGLKHAAYSEANWGNNLDNGKSTSLYVGMLANSSMSFKVGLQSLNMQSTMEAELLVTALTMKRAVFCSNIMVELGFEKGFSSVPLYLDKIPTLHITCNRTYSSWAKHIALSYFSLKS